jgi:hypothetical protein
MVIFRNGTDGNGYYTNVTRNDLHHNNPIFIDALCKLVINAGEVK